MKKRETKIQLHRETLRKLETPALEKVQGGLMNGAGFACTGCDSGCGIID
jgi:hypothetical protein